MAWDIIRRLDTALKHRLTGAVILVLLAVLLLPELLTGSGRAQGPRGSVTGSSDTAERSFDIDLTAGSANPLVVAPPMSAESLPAPPAAPLNLPVPAAAIAAPSTAEAAAPVTNAASSVAKAAAPPASAQSAAPATAAVPNTVPAKADAPNTAPASNAAPASNTASEPSSAYFVQLGVFVNRASASNLAKKLQAAKFAVKVDEIRRNDKVLHRVRVGPEVDRAAANALLKRLADAGHKGSVVK